MKNMQEADANGLWRNTQMDETSYTETTGTTAQKSGAAQGTIVDYCRLGLLDHITLPNGMRLLRSGQEGRVKELYAARIANRGRRANSAG